MIISKNFTKLTSLKFFDHFFSLKSSSFSTELNKFSLLIGSKGIRFRVECLSNFFANCWPLFLILVEYFTEFPIKIAI
ncbi:hypothetical protein BpHYR1_037304 [Brachionus plicatilis]|uniref:Uncharacterized protein n=1 Tax=Brachionus plicatilis TaxID=10195 RepID=A0A3M7RY13_BRAPC|nr:hypothetical protein BpHYR1_037304 [Brachionus plicatilis]